MHVGTEVAQTTDFSVPLTPEKFTDVLDAIPTTAEV